MKEFSKLTHEYSDVLKMEADESLRWKSRSLCEDLMEHHGYFAALCSPDWMMMDMVAAMIGKLQTHVGDQ